MDYLNNEECVPTKIKVIGVGGCGGNSINNIIDSGLDGVEFYSMNTDIQALKKSIISKNENKIILGKSITKGLGAGSKPEIGLQAADESKEEIMNAVENADMIFITAGMGGGSGTGAAPVVARYAKESGALTVGVVTMPFEFEGTPRRRNAEEGLKNLKSAVDAIIVIPNQKLIEAVPKASVQEAFRLSDEILVRGVQGLSDLILRTGLINLDFADVRTIMKDSGTARMGIGTKSGEGKAAEAAMEAITSPLLEGSIKGAKGIIINVSGGKDLNIMDLSKATETIRKEADADANIITGIYINENSRDNGEIQVTVIATGFDKYNEKPQQSTYDINNVFSINKKIDIPQKPKTDSKNQTEIPEKKTVNRVDIPDFLKEKSN